MKPYAQRLVDPPEIPVVVSIPHTGTYVPETVKTSFASDYIRTLPMTDWHLAELYAFLPGLGVDSVYATYSRFIADLNRPPSPRELYPGRFETGLVALQTFKGEDIYTTPPSKRAVEDRRNLVHAPYHERLKELLDDKIARFGVAVLVDAHSVASTPSLVHGKLEDDIYLGDRDGKSCEPWLSDLLDDTFAQTGLSVVRNSPYKGGYITDHYGALPRIQAIQIEMCQRLYMDETDPAGALSKPKFGEMAKRLEGIFATLVKVLRDKYT